MRVNMMDFTIFQKPIQTTTKNLCKICTALALLTAAHNTAQAGPGDIHFNGDITNSAYCIIFVTQSGALVPNVDATQLSSKLPGGVAGKAEIWSFRKYDISVSSPTYFNTYPTGGDVGVNFTTTFSGQSLRKGKTFDEQSGDIPVSTRNRFGRTQVTVNLVADKPDGFPAGDYSAQTVVRCE